MPPSKSRRQPQDTRLWKKSSNMDRRSTLQPRGSLGHGNFKSDSFSGVGLRARLVVTRDRDGGANTLGERGDDDVGRHVFRGVNENLDDSDSESSGDELGDISDDDSGSDDDDLDDAGNVPQQAIQPPPASSSGSIVTLTALPPSKATGNLPKMMTTTPLPELPPPSKPNLAPIVTTTSPGVSIIPGSPTPSTGRKEAGPDTTPPLALLPDIQPTATSTSTSKVMSTTSAIAEMQESGIAGNDNDSDGDKHKYHNKDAPPPGGLDPTAEHLLIAAGAIGAFILFCFIGWIVYRVMKRTKGQGVGVDGGMGFIDRFPWRRRGPMDGTWDGRTLYMANETPPIYEKGEYDTMQSGGFYGPNKAYPPGPGSAARSVVSNSETGTLRKLPNITNDGSALASIIDQYPPGNEEVARNGDARLTMRSQATQPYYNESELPRQQRDTFNPPKRAGNRASELSSISSGFGDGDIIIPPPLAVSKSPTDEAADNPTARDASRDSWMSREGGRRETVYTTTSEDRPARFRSISSWVNQQAGRAKRAGSRARDRGEVPVMPAIPGEISAIRQTAYR
ncbi:hypothetical protein F4804DRAFT_250650 [Jackrogersella minutella]|nr:hypothetical protein F4804DRAFT_250650 [Jackrogersella minutella]